MLVMILSRELINAFQKLQRSSVAFRNKGLQQWAVTVTNDYRYE